MKVLILSHNPISIKNNMGKTLGTLFCDFKKEELCQFYIYPTFPDVKKCISYYRISDKDILKSYCKFRVNGTVIVDDNIDENVESIFENTKDKNLYKNKKNKKPFRMLLRDLMWKLSRWYNRDIKNWIEEQRPTHLFVAPGNAKFIYDIALKISKKYNLPIITYICDDYYFVKKAKGLLGKIQQNSLKRITRKLFRKTSYVISICDRLKVDYQNAFNVEATTVMTGSNYTIATEPKNFNVVNEITYLGNIRCNRYKSIVEIGKTLDEINQENETNYKLNIYTPEKDEEILSSFNGISSIKLCGYVSGKEFDKVFHNCQALLHVEAFDEDSVDLVKNSISTKIADSLGSGIVLFAYGPESIASMQYLIENDSAICCTKKEELKNKLKLLFESSEERERKIINAINVAKENHDLTTVGKKVRELMKKVNDESSAS